jgi:uncharacterized protein (DUF111 family)
VTRTAYLDCVGGLAGDMLLAALLDAGAELETLRSVPGALGLEGVRIDVERVERQGIGALHLHIEAADDHDRDYAHIRELVSAAALPEQARARSLEAFRRLAEVEGGIHGISAEEDNAAEVREPAVADDGDRDSRTAAARDQSRCAHQHGIGGGGGGRRTYGMSCEA